MDAFPYARAEQVMGTKYPCGTFTPDGNAVFFSNERPYTPNSPRGMRRFHGMNGIDQVAFVWWRSSFLPWILDCGMTCLKCLVRNLQNPCLPSKGNTGIFHLRDHEPINPSFFLNACMAMAWSATNCFAFVNS